MKKAHKILLEDRIEYRLPNGDLHRLDGPAVEFHHGGKYWFSNGERHRLDGPAVECSNGNRFWYIAGKKCFE